MATCIELSGASYPEELPALAGNSLLPALKSSRRPVHHGPIYWEHEGNAAMRDGDLKLVREYEKPWELYDLSHDRTELNNLVEHNPETAKRMVHKWETWASQTGVAYPERFNMYQFLREKQKSNRQANP